jgi:hypothetical protein
MKHVRFSLGIVALMLILLGCAKPPDTEREAAKAAMDAAVSAGADKYASADLDAATKVWDTAESQMKEKKYKEAKQSYFDAKAAFEKASAAVEAGKKAAADQANASLSALGESWKNLEVTARKMAKRMKEKKEEWTADAGALSEGLAKAKEMIATDPAGTKAKLDELKGIVDKWESTFKKMASASTESKAVKKKSVKKKVAKKKVAEKKAVKKKTVKKNDSQKTKE